MNVDEIKIQRQSTKFDAVLKAVKDVLINKKSSRSAAAAHNIPKTNLYRYISKVKMHYPDISIARDDELLKLICAISTLGPSTIFSSEEEQALTDYILKCSQIYSGLSSIKLRQLVFEFAREIHVKYPAAWDSHQMAGKDWYYAFIKRHANLPLRIADGDDGIYPFNTDIFTHLADAELSSTSSNDLVAAADQCRTPKNLSPLLSDPLRNSYPKQTLSTYGRKPMQCTTSSTPIENNSSLKRKSQTKPTKQTQAIPVKLLRTQAQGLSTSALLLEDSAILNILP